MATARDLITASLRLLGVKAQGQSATGAEAMDALEVLKEMIDAFNASDALLFHTKTLVYPLATLSQTYTMGPTGQIVVPTRPTRLVNAVIRDNSNSPANDIRLLILSDKDYLNITTKGVTSDFPAAIYMDRNFPNATIYLWPVPSDTSKSLVMQYLEPLSTSLTLDTQVDLPPAYRQAMRYNLAVLLAPEYGLEAPQTVQLMAMTSKTQITNANTQVPLMEFDWNTPGLYNINSDSVGYNG